MKFLQLALASVALIGAVWAVQSFGTGTSGASAQPDGDALVRIVLPEDLSDLAQVGKTVFTAACANCHGTDGVGRDGAGPPLVHKIYEPSHHGDQSFYLAVDRGVRAHHWRFGNMAPVDGLTHSDVAAIIAYIREVQRANGIY